MVLTRGLAANPVVGQLFQLLVTCISSFPIALCVAKFGHSPGKWLLGITVERKDGTALSFRQALWREYSAFFRGMAGGLYLVFAVLIAGVLLYRYLKKEGETAWDKKLGTRVLYLAKPRGRFIIAISLLVAFCLDQQPHRCNPDLDLN
ncbi:MAG: RDD family protein [Rhizomicrobium sp.]